MDPAALHARVLAAIDARAELCVRLHAEGTDCYRLFHGVSEGLPGLAIDRYGPLLLAHEFRGPLAVAQREAVAAAVAARFPAMQEVWCTRGVEVPDFQGDGSRLLGRCCLRSPLRSPSPQGSETVEAHEGGARFAVAAWHRGQDPWLFLDFRCARRWLRAHAGGRSVLNLFAYTCTAGVAAALGGASEVWNVDFARSSIDVGRDNAARNGVTGCMRFIRADCLAILRQLAGQPVQRRGKALPYLRVERRTFDLVVLDPPPLAKSPFGTVDARADYESLFKPALLATAPGGMVLAANNCADVAWAEFERRLRRCAEKAGRSLRELTRLLPEADFPSFDGEPPLKVALCLA